MASCLPYFDLVSVRICSTIIYSIIYSRLFKLSTIRPWLNRWYHDFAKRRDNTILAPIPTLTPQSNPSYPIKRLTPTEFQNPQTKGLCFNREDKYFSSHKCSTKRILPSLPDNEDNNSDSVLQMHHITNSMVTQQFPTMPLSAPPTLTPSSC